MILAQIYRCLADPTRLRILHLLAHTPLCVCHFQEVLGESQVKISKHLAYLRSQGVVIATRAQNWMIYSLPEKPSSALKANVGLLRALASTDAALRRDLAKLQKLACNCDAPAGALRLRGVRSRRG